MLSEKPTNPSPILNLREKGVVTGESKLYSKYTAEQIAGKMKKDLKMTTKRRQ